MPIGSNSFSYSYRDLDGSIVNNFTKKEYGKCFNIGDVIGILLYLSRIRPIR